MAYPIRLFDLQTEEGKMEGTKFLLNLDKTLTKLFGKVSPQEKLSKFHKFDEIPDYLKELAEKSIKEIVKQLPEGDLKWKGTLGIYGRKDHTTIKRDNNLIYRMIINIGDSEVYYIDGEGFNEPVVLPNCYTLLFSPIMIDKVDIKVKADPIRKNLSSKISQFVPKIKGRNYMRSTIVIDLLADGLKLHTSDSQKCKHEGCECSE